MSEAMAAAGAGQPGQGTGAEPGDFDDLDLLALDPMVDSLTVYVPPGPASLRFLNDPAMSVFVMGPIGSGKTTTTAFLRIIDGAHQGIGKDGWIRDRALVLRKTWRTAKRTVLKSWQEWFDKGYPGSTWTGGEDRPATHVLRFEDPRRKVMVKGREQPVRIELETEFMGLDESNIDAILRGSPYSRIWLNETDQFNQDILEECEGRVGRYPSLDSLAPGERRTKRVMGDFNAPDKTNFLYDLFVENPRPGRSLISLPPGLLVDWNADGTIARARVNPEAENLSKLDPDYYTSKVDVWEDWRLRRLVLNEWGYSREGLPVFLKEFVERLHVAAEMIRPEPGLGLVIGIDISTGGLRPAAVFMQPAGAGQLRVIETVAPGHGWGPVRFFELVKATIDAHYRNAPWIEAYGDPASQYGGDREGGQLSAMETGSVILGVPIQIPAGGSNEITLRLDAIRAELQGVVEGERRRLLISPHPSNKPIIQGFASGYRFQKKPKSLLGEWQPVPVKDSYSDPMDALGYGVMGYRRIQPTTLARPGFSSRNAGFSASRRGGAPGRPNDFDVFSI